MCTLVVASHVFEGFPVVVVANRDERLDRPATPPFVWPQGFLAPRDDVAGGTWIGVNASGVFVAITNRYRGPNDLSRKSRGALVSDALALPSARAIHESLARLPGDRHNGFHLVYADAKDTLATVSNGASIAQVTLGHGVHIITERGFAAGDDSRRIERIHTKWKALATPPGLDLPRLSQLLTDHAREDDLESVFGATCIHVPGMPYGTRSGAALSVDKDAASRLLWAEGPPCTTPFAPVSGTPKNR